MKVEFVGGPLDGNIMETDYLTDCIVIANQQSAERLGLREGETTGPLPSTTRYRPHEIRKGYETLWFYSAEGVLLSEILRRAAKV